MRSNLTEAQSARIEQLCAELCESVGAAVVVVTVVKDGLGEMFFPPEGNAARHDSEIIGNALARGLMVPTEYAIPAGENN